MVSDDSLEFCEDCGLLMKYCEWSGRLAFLLMKQKLNDPFALAWALGMETKMIDDMTPQDLVDAIAVRMADLNKDTERVMKNKWNI